MTTFESGLWIFLVIGATGFTFMSLKTVDKASVAFHMLAMALWMGLAVIHSAGFEVAATSTNLTYNETGNLIFNETKSDTLIPGGTSASWISWLFLSFAIFNLGMVFKQVVKL